MVTIKVQNLIDFVAEVFARADSSPEEARRIARYLTTANLTGHDSHGVIRVPVYIRWNKMGSVVPDQKVEVELDEWGAGTRHRTFVLLTIFRAKQIAESLPSASKVTPIIIVEEPESFLHPLAQAEFQAHCVPPRNLL